MGRRKLVRILMETGLVDLTAKNQQNETPIDISIRKRYSEILEILQNPPKVRREPLEGPNPDETQSTANNPRSDRINRLNHETDGKSINGKGVKKSNTGKKGSRNRNRSKEPGWSPYGCHYFPDLEEFPIPKIESLPKDPLSPGEQYYLDLAGNIRKGPVSDAYTCYCTPFIEKFEQKMDRNKRELVRHLEATHGKLAHKIWHLERRTKDQISSLSNSMKETIAQERVECQDRVERRAIRDRVALERQQTIRDLILKGDLSTYLDQRLREVEQGRERKHGEEEALMRTLLRGSRRRKRAIISEIQQTGSLRRALSEDELGPGDIEDNKKQDDAFMFVTRLDNNFNENLAVQSEYGDDVRGHLLDNNFGFGFESLESHLEELRVMDHPQIDPVFHNSDSDHPVYQNATQVHPKSTTVRVRRSSAGDEATLICDFGDFKTQELISPSPSQDFSSQPPTSLTSFHRGGRSSHDVYNYSTNSESYHGNSSTTSSQYQPYPRTHQHTDQTLSVKQVSSGAIYQNYNHESNHITPPIMPKPVRPFAPSLFNFRLPNKPVYQNQQPVLGPSSRPSPPPRVPPKQNLPPPYRPPPPNQTNMTQIQRNFHPLFNGGNPSPQQQPLQAFFMPPIEEDANLVLNPLMVHIHGGPKYDRHPVLGLTTTTGALSSSDGGSHDSHNDSGYYALRPGGGGCGSSAAGSGGPSPSLSGSHGRPDSRCQGVDDQPHTMALRAASIGILNGGNTSVAPRIRQLQHQLGTTKTRIPATSALSVASTGADSAIGLMAPRGSLV